MGEVTNIKLKISNVFQYLKLLNGFLELTDTERLVLSALIEVHLERPGDPAVSTYQKKLAAEKLGRKNFNSLNNYIKVFKDKKLLKKEIEGYSFNPILLPANQIRFTLTWPETLTK